MNSPLIRDVGRIAGVTAAETRERLLQAAADVFARRGYDGTRVADIAAAAGVSHGALYAHFGSKAELMVAALRTHGRKILAEQFAADPDQPIAELFRIGQAGGEIDTGLSPNALAHFCLLLSMGSALITPELHGVGDDEWAALLTRIVAAVAPTTHTGVPQ